MMSIKIAYKTIFIIILNYIPQYIKQFIFIYIAYFYTEYIFSSDHFEHYLYLLASVIVSMVIITGIMRFYNLITLITLNDKHLSFR